MAEPGRWLELKTHLYGWFHRLSGTDVVTATQVSTGTGGGRIATLGAIVGFCLSGLGAGTVCVVTGVIELPLSPAPKEAPAPRQKPEPKRTPEPKKSPSREPKRALPIAATKAMTQDSAPVRPGRRSKHENARETGTAASRRRKATASAQREFDFEGSNGGGTEAPSGGANAPQGSTSAAAATPTFEEAVQQVNPQPSQPNTQDPAALEFGG